jgi:hypothetical protein
MFLFSGKALSSAICVRDFSSLGCANNRRSFMEKMKIENGELKILNYEL